MSGHTPGPWRARSKHQPIHMAPGSRMYVLEQGGADEFNIGFVCSWRDNPKDAEEAKSNATLIAAAPDLLEALEKGVIRLESNLDDDRDMGRGSMTYLLEIFQEAIARAKGLTSS